MNHAMQHLAINSAFGLEGSGHSVAPTNQILKRREYDVPFNAHATSVAALSLSSSNSSIPAALSNYSQCNQVMFNWQVSYM